MKNEKNKSENTGFWEETKENINEGARVVEKDAKEISDKIVSYSEAVFGKVREYAEDIFDSGVSLSKEAVNKAQDYAENLRDSIEIRKLNDEKKKLSSQLGISFYLEVKNNDNKVPPTIMRRKQFKSLFKDIEDIDKKILDLSEDEKAR